MFECPVTTTARAQMYHVIKASVNGESKLQQCLNLSCDEKKVARLFLVICGMISMHLCPRQLLCFCRRLGAFAMHISMTGTPVDVFESASERYIFSYILICKELQSRIFSM
jgi:hypothetical protein